MTSAVRTNVTADELLRMPDDGMRYELIEGVLQMMSPAGGQHGRVAMKLAWLLTGHVERLRLGTVYAAETGFMVSKDPDTVRAPDVAFVCAERLVSLDDDTGFLPFAPDLACEIVSPYDSFSAVEEKALSWLAAGTQLVLVVDPGGETLHAYRAPDHIVVLDSTQTLDADDVVPGWKINVSQLFQ